MDHLGPQTRRTKTPSPTWYPPEWSLPTPATETQDPGERYEELNKAIDELIDEILKSRTTPIPPLELPYRSEVLYKSGVLQHLLKNTASRSREAIAVVVLPPQDGDQEAKRRESGPTYRVVEDREELQLEGGAIPKVDVGAFLSKKL